MRAQRVPLGLRRRSHRARLLHTHPAGSVGDASAVVPSSAPVPVPIGFVPIFAGWNVWDIWQADKPSFSVMTVGESLQRQLQVWIENAIKDGAPGAAVADPLNPAALRGDQIQPIAPVKGLAIAATRADIPDLAGAKLDSGGDTATLRTVRFWSRATAPRYALATTMPWAHDDDYLLNVVYQPSAGNAVTNAPQPGSLAGTGSDIAAGVGTALNVIAIGGAAVLGVVLIVSLVNSSKKVAA